MIDLIWLSVFLCQLLWSKSCGLLHSNSINISKKGNNDECSYRRCRYHGIYPCYLYFNYTELQGKGLSSNAMADCEQKLGALRFNGRETNVNSMIPTAGDWKL